MKPPPAVRWVVFTAHVMASVGWLGAVVAFLGFAVVGLMSQDPETARGAYLVMEPAGSGSPLSSGFRFTPSGLVQAFVTPWGLFRHYWVVFKLVINLVGPASCSPT